MATEDAIEMKSAGEVDQETIAQRIAAYYYQHYRKEAFCHLHQQKSGDDQGFAELLNDADILKRVTALLLKKGANLTLGGEDGSRFFGKTFLTRLADKRRFDLMKAVAEALAEVGEPSRGIQKELAGILHRAIQAKQQVDVVEALCRAGADLTVKNSDGNEPLHAAGWLGETDIAVALIMHDADVSATNKTDKTAMQLAADDKCWPLVEAMANAITAKKGGGAKDTAGCAYALMRAIDYDGPVSAVKALALAGADCEK